MLHSLLYLDVFVLHCSSCGGVAVGVDGVVVVMMLLAAVAIVALVAVVILTRCFCC